MAKQYDPFMHTAEHVLNRTMVNLFNCGRSYSSHLNSDKSKCDYHFPRPLEEKEAREIERLVNEVLGKNLPVTMRMVPWEEAEKIVNLSKIPEDVDRSLPVRLVYVGDYDVCPCIGEHVENTSEIGLFRLISHDYTPAETGGQEGRLRIRFKLKKKE